MFETVKCMSRVLTKQQVSALGLSTEDRLIGIRLSVLLFGQPILRTIIREESY